MPRINFVSAKKIVANTLVVSLVFSLGYFIGSRYNLFEGKERVIEVKNRERQEVDFNLFWNVWDTLREEYYDKTKLNAENMVYGAISGMVSGLGDPYTAFISPKDNKVVQDDLKGSFEGVGIQIGYKGTALAVIAPLKGSPAEKAGVLPGDFIIGITDETKGIELSTAGMSLPDAIKIIRGAKGTQVELTLLRKGNEKPLEIKIIREEIEVPSVVLELVGEGKNIAHLQVTKFTSDTKGEWDEAVKEILKGNVLGIILDLRNNPGGYLQGAVDLSSDFVESGSLVTKEEYSDGKFNEFKTEGLPRLKKYKTVVLVNEGSASASEIMAAALKENLNILLIGEKTFGKGTIQEPKQFEDGSALHITIAKWLTSKGLWVNEKGLVPDVEAKDNPETLDVDEQLDTAIQKLLNF